MKITKRMQSYLTGEKFSTGEYFNFIDSCMPNDNRLSALIKLTKNKSVIHLGACDHLPVIARKRKSRTWLHDLLNKNCSKVIGIDINKEAIKYCKQNGVENIIYGNMLSNKKAEIDYIHTAIQMPSRKKWDYLVAGEILEHVDNPVAFLKSINEKYSDSIDRCMITVPNALRYLNFQLAQKGQV